MKHEYSQKIRVMNARVVHGDRGNTLEFFFQLQEEDIPTPDAMIRKEPAPRELANEDCPHMCHRCRSAGKNRCLYDWTEEQTQERMDQLQEKCNDDKK